MRTTAVLTTQEGINLVASSEASLAPVQQSLLLPGEIPVLGQAGVHAELKLVIAAITSDLTPYVMYVSRSVCPACTEMLNNLKIPFVGP